MLFRSLLVTEVAGPARLLVNVAPRRGRWLLVRAVDPARGGRDAIGAEVLVEAGGRKRIGFVLPSKSYLSGCDPRVHFGLGAADRVDSIEVRWPHGGEEVFPGGSADRLVTLRKGEGRPVPQAPAPSPASGGERP